MNSRQLAAFAVGDCVNRIKFHYDTETGMPVVNRQAAFDDLVKHVQSAIEEAYTYYGIDELDDSRVESLQRRVTDNKDPEAWSCLDNIAGMCESKASGIRVFLKDHPKPPPQTRQPYAKGAIEGGWQISLGWLPRRKKMKEDQP